jgi:type IV pilus assembly protein PilC
MANYKYKARNSAGKVQEGTIAGPSKDMAKTMLSRQRLVVITLQEVQLDADGKEVGGLSLLGGRIKIDGKGNIVLGGGDKFKVPDKDLIVMTKQLSTMLGSGLPVNQSLDILSRQQRLPQFGEVLAGLRKAIEEGSSLSLAMARYPLCFDDLFRAMVKAGEESGKLADIMAKLLVYIEKSSKIKSQVKSALTYPTLILVVAVVVITGLLVFVVPTFTAQFINSGKELPALTQFVISLSDFIAAQWLKIFGSIGVAIFGATQYQKTPKGRVYFDGLILRLPLIGDVMKKIAVGRFCSTMASMLSSGVNLLQALSICAASAGNVVLEEFILSCKTRIEKGQQLSVPLSENPMFPKMVISMVQVGEKSGKLDEMLMKISSFYEEEVDEAVKTMLSMIEPIMIVGIGSVVGVLVIAMYLPIMDMGNTVGG